MYKYLYVQINALLQNCVFALFMKPAAGGSISGINVNSVHFLQVMVWFCVV